MQVPTEAKGIGSAGAGVADGCKMPNLVVGADLWFSERAIMHLKSRSIDGRAGYSKIPRPRKAGTGEQTSR